MLTKTVVGVTSNRRIEKVLIDKHFSIPILSTDWISVSLSYQHRSAIEYIKIDYYYDIKIIFFMMETASATLISHRTSW